MTELQKISNELQKWNINNDSERQSKLSCVCNIVKLYTVSFLQHVILSDINTFTMQFYVKL